ncbi:sensor histidine kinase [Actinocorallia sp. A-T 12471]|uniref:sensor histidine kinase n=1 Tax=Actinocorallia sp. A-T 12471 TaxID=3089813 RepID=UPI0029D25FFE|nr:histidine kinase [Actinocorallia sp. A-T 12471]MDX6744805.1 histidine kinase [Actinocorallia sp. A-T 12471]
MTDAPPAVPSGRAASPWKAAALPALFTVFALACTVCTAVLDTRNAVVDLPPGTGIDGVGWTASLCGLVQVASGGLLLYRLPRHPVAWALTLSGLHWALNGLAGAWVIHGVYLEPGLPGLSAAFFLYARFGAALMLGLPLLLLLFPDGRLPAARPWRVLSVFSLGLTALLPVVWALVPSSVVARLEGSPPPEMARLTLDPIPVGMSDEFWTGVVHAAHAALPVTLLVPVAVVVHRYRKAEAEGRAQIRWLLWAAVVNLGVLVLPPLLGSGFPVLLLYAGISLTSLAILVAVAKYRLYDIDRLLPATVLYGLLAAVVVALDVAVFTVAGGVLGERDSALAAIAVVAVAYAPLRTWLWRLARRLVHGSRDDPYATVSTLAARLDQASGPEEQLGALARTVADAFALPYVRVEIERPDGTRSVVEHGVARGPSVSLPVVYSTDAVGRLVLCRAELTDRDQRLLGDLVRQAAAAARASELSADLQRIRAKLVAAREEERRRLRRDLHDGLGPSLGAVALRIELARNLAVSAPERSDAILEQTAAEVSGVMADVRRLVHDLRPPALDELGVLRAVEQHADRLRSTSLQIVVVGGDGLDGLPAAVEVAAYRIVSEALANVVRHSGAGRCEVTLAARGHVLEVEVHDDGSGIGRDTAAGVGMLSLRERAAELGGDCAVTCPDGGGTLVRARLPLEMETAVA